MIRTAQQEEYEQVEAIMQQAQRLHTAWRPDIYCAAETVCPRAYFEQLLDVGEVLVAVEEDQVVGVAIFKELVVPAGGIKVGRRTLLVDTLAVLEDRRGTGVGTALLEELKRLARQKKCAGLELQVNAKNERARKLYQKEGFTEKSINMELNF